MKYKLVPINQPKLSARQQLSCLDDEKLIKLYDKTKAWLIEHEAQTGTQNLFDVSGQEYDPRKYEAKLGLIEKIEDEGRKREITAFLPIKEIQKIFES